MGKVEVGCDTFAFRMQNYGGVTNVIENLFKELNGKPMYGMKMSFYETLPPNWSSRMEVGSQNSRLYFLKRIRDKLFPSAMRRDRRINIRLLGYHFDPVEDIYRDVPLVCMVYDFIPERLPELFKDGSPHLDKLEILQRAALAVCISEQTKHDLYRYVPNFQGRTVVIPLASKFPLSFRVDHEPTFKSPYLLYVGRRDSYKNVDIFLQTVSLFPNLDFVLFGGGDLTEKEQLLIGAEHLSRVHCISGDDSQLQSLYENATALVFPSKLEGFGLPILEAMSLGCPVVASKIEVFEELFGDAVAYFDHENVFSLVEVVEDLMSDTLGRCQRIDRGFELAKKFTWTNAAQLFSQACKDLLKDATK